MSSRNGESVILCNITTTNQSGSYPPVHFLRWIWAHRWVCEVL